MSYLFVHLKRFTAKKKQTECFCSVNLTHLSGPTVTFVPFQIHTIRQLILSLQQARSVRSFSVHACKKSQHKKTSNLFNLLYMSFMYIFIVLNAVYMNAQLYNSCHIIQLTNLWFYYFLIIDSVLLLATTFVQLIAHNHFCGVR